MQLQEIHRFPVKSVLGETLAAVEVDGRGLVGDRSWAVVDHDGKLGSGKSSRRFRRMDGLLTMRAALDGAGPGGSDTDVPVVRLPDGRSFRAGDPEGDRAVSGLVGRPVRLARETDVQHHDDGPVSVVTTSALRALADLLGDGAPVDVRRFRANLVVDARGPGFVEDDWVGADLHVGDAVVLRPVERSVRCVMVDMAHGDVPADGRVLRTLGDRHDLELGVWCTVVRPGRIRRGAPISVAEPE